MDLLPDDIPYRSAVGALIYAVTGTRPDLAHSVGVLSRYLATPGKQHWQCVKRVLKYIKGTTDLGLFFDGSLKDALILHGFMDADWANDTADRRSTSAYLFKLCGAPVSWKSKRQPTVSLSTTEAEYMAASLATQEAVWLRQLLSDLCVMQIQPTVLYEDNRGCIDLVNNPVHHQRTKHIDIRHHFVREQQQAGAINLVYCPTKEMQADALTKALPAPAFELLRNNFAMKKSADTMA